MTDRPTVYAGGSWHRPGPGAATMTVVNPATEEPVATLDAAGAAEIDRAVRAARDAFPGWAALGVAERIDRLERLLAAYEKSQDDIANLITTELGAPLTLAREHHAAAPVTAMRAALDIAREYPYEQAGDGTVLVREPIGVVGAVTPWNDPMLLTLIKAVPAMAAGCTVVHKPAELTPLCGLRLAELADAADLPPGVFNTVAGLGSDAGQRLDEHPDVDMVAFTGSTAAGRKVLSASAGNVKKTLLELGGKSPSVVLPDADVETVAREQMIDTCRNSGQFCGAMTRLLVPRDRMAQAAEGARAGAETIVVGDPRDDRTTMGPVVSAGQRDRIREYIDYGTAHARLITGGARPPAGLTRGFYVAPTVFADVDNGSRLAQEEIFGPVLVIIGYRDEEEAVRLANDTVYGLRATVWSGDADRARAVARRIRAGQVDLNGFKFRVDAPFGGYRQSGIGRTLGVPGFEEFLELKSIQL